jgi:hypothetical protein
MHNEARKGGQRHPRFLQGRIEDFDFSHRGDTCLGGGPPHGGTGHFPSRGRQLCFPPSNIDTSTGTGLGGMITTPCFVDRFHVAWAKNTSKFDLASLAEAKYHIGKMGVEVLTPQIISNCGYQSFHRDHPEDILLCYSEIANIHCLILQGWTNYWMHFSGPVVEYILKKALPVFPRLNSLEVVDIIKFYDSVQKISMKYPLPLMLFVLICLAFGFEGLCPPGWGRSCTRLLRRRGWMSFPASSQKMIRMLSRSSFWWGMSQTMDLTSCGVLWNWRFWDLNPLI